MREACRGRTTSRNWIWARLDFIRFSLVDPGVAWLKLKSLSEGAELASAEL
jgi:hypothetical protein